MFFRQTKTPSGRVLQLLESYRDSEGVPRHSVVVSLGDAMIDPAERKAIAAAVAASLHGQGELLPRPLSACGRRLVERIVKRVDREGRWKPKGAARPSRNFTETDSAAGEEDVVQGVVLDRVDHTHTSSLGPALVGLRVWERLGMTQLLGTLGFNKAQRKAAAISVINRLVDPVTENFLTCNWLENSSLPDLLGQEVLKGYHERFYRVSDKLYEHRETIEAHLRKTQAEHFNLSRTVLLYDLTNTHFEGVCKHNPKAKRGRNKQKRHDCPQVVVGMVVDEFGFELAHQTFAGNQNDAKSLVEMVSTLKKMLKEDGSLSSTLRPLVVVDSGVATKANLKVLRAAGYKYLVNDSRRGRKRYHEPLTDAKGFTKVSGRMKNGVERPPVEVKVIEEKHTEKETYEVQLDDGSAEERERQIEITENVVLCRSEARREKEAAILSKAEERFLAKLHALAERVQKGQLKDAAKVQQAIGRIKAGHTRVSGFYRIDMEYEHEPKSERRPVKKRRTTKKSKKQNNARVRQVVWHRDDERLHANDDLFGCYVLRTDKLDLSAEEYWRLYISLTYAEDGFRALKSDLGLRPNPHRLEGRVDAHIFITILAYHLLHHILYALRLQGDQRCWFTICHILQTHCYTTILLPTIHGKLYRLRRPGQPEQEQKQIYQSLGINPAGLPTSKIVSDTPLLCSDSKH
jgi:transposase